ncbi:hypothetical protein HDU93_002114 [Gonapodya sp. JEL0774]|nr:hypothetical protein HDU93_002114 [Gonapodya sp. JEL0774]
MSRGILKHNPDDKSNTARLRWDEDNLLITEATKGGKMPITEPKTPFVRYDSATNMILGHSAVVPPLELERALADQAEGRRGGGMDDFDLDGGGLGDAWDGNDGAEPFSLDRGAGHPDHETVPAPPHPHVLSNPPFAMLDVGSSSAAVPHHALEVDMEDAPTSHQGPNGDWDDDEEDQRGMTPDGGLVEHKAPNFVLSLSLTSPALTPDLAKRREFDQHRKSHYNMRQDMLRARQLLAKEDDDEEDDGDGVERSPYVPEDGESEEDEEGEDVGAEPVESVTALRR